MGRVVVVGERGRVAGFALAGAEVVATERDDEIVAAWSRLGADVAVVVLTPTAARVLGERLEEPPSPGHPLPVVMPEVGR